MQGHKYICINILKIIDMMDSFLFLTHRENKTSITRRKLKPKLQVDGDSFFLEKRPFTTYIGRHANPYAYRSLNNAE